MYLMADVFQLLAGYWLYTYRFYYFLKINSIWFFIDEDGLLCTLLEGIYENIAIPYKLEARKIDHKAVLIFTQFSNFESGITDESKYGSCYEKTVTFYHTTFKLHNLYGFKYDGK